MTRYSFRQLQKKGCFITATVPNKMPKGVQAKENSYVHQTRFAESRDTATKARDQFLEKYNTKHEAGCSFFSKGGDVILAFYDFPAEHWGLVWATNPCRGKFSTFRLRHRPTKAIGSRKASLTMMFKLAQSASRRWRRLNGHHRIILILE